MAEKRFNGRIVLKHDVESNWLLATGFTPMAGEIIIYDIDDNYAYERIKIGDGVQNVNDLPFIDDALREDLVAQISDVDTKVDVVSALVGDTSVATQISSAIDEIPEQIQADLAQNDETAIDYVKNRTHYTETVIVNEPLNITWDGNTDGLTAVNSLYKVSDLVLTDEQIKSGTLTVLGKSDPIELSSLWDSAESNGTATDNYVSLNEYIVFVRKAGVTFFTMYFSECGIYFTKYSDTLYPTSLTTTEPVEQTSVVVRQLDEKYIPDTIARAPKITSVTLAAENWTGDANPWSQVITINGVTANSKVDLQPTAVQIVELQNADIMLMVENDGESTTAYAIGGKPEVDYTMQALITEVIPV